MIEPSAASSSSSATTSDWRCETRSGLYTQTRLEILYSARSADDYARLADELDGLHRIASDANAFARAEAVQRALSEVGGLHHRSVKIADLVIAASAELAGLTVLHYDEDFDRVAVITGQHVEWIAARGSL